MCYWEIGYGFLEYDINDMNFEVRRWLCEENKLGGPIVEDTHQDLLYSEIQDFMAT